MVLNVLSVKDFYSLRSKYILFERKLDEKRQSVEEYNMLEEMKREGDRRAALSCYSDPG